MVSRSWTWIPLFDRLSPYFMAQTCSTSLSWPWLGPLGHLYCMICMFHGFRRAKVHGVLQCVLYSSIYIYYIYIFTVYNYIYIYMHIHQLLVALVSSSIIFSACGSRPGPLGLEVSTLDSAGVLERYARFMQMVTGGNATTLAALLGGGPQWALAGGDADAGEDLKQSHRGGFKQHTWWYNGDWYHGDIMVI